MGFKTANFDFESTVQPQLEPRNLTIEYDVALGAVHFIFWRAMVFLK